MLFCKLKPPQNQFKVVCNSTSVNPIQLLKTIEATNMESIGLGINNFMTKANLELKMQLAEKAFNLQLTEDAISQVTGVSNIDAVKL